MSSDQNPPPGTIFWRDLTVENAGQVRDFYQQVVGRVWRGEDMGDYEDYHINSSLSVPFSNLQPGNLQSSLFTL